MKSGKGCWAGVGIPEGALDLSYGFDDPNFSDRTLLLQIIDHADTNDDRSLSLRNKKLRRSHRLQNMKGRRSDCALNNASTHTTFSPRPRTKTVHINSLILAARSPFFHKLFSNGMQESEQKHVTLRIEALEKVPFMNLMKYVYSNNLPTTLNALLDLLVIAEKFEVDSCLRDCIRVLQTLEMTCESASLYLDLSTSLLMSPTVQPLIDAAKQFLVEEFEYFDEDKEGVLNLPLLGLQAVLSSDDLQVTSEIVVYECALEWVRKHCSDLEERREILKTHLLHLIRFPFMTTTQLTKDILTCNDIDPELASKIVIRALSFKAEADSYRKQCLAAEEGSAASHGQFVERAYRRYQPIKVVKFESHQQCVVYLDLTRNKLNSLFPDGHVWSETFRLSGQEFGLSVRTRHADKREFWLALDVSESSTSTVKYEFAVRRKPLENFQSWFEGIHTFTVGEDLKYLHGEKWSRFIGDDRSYFINDFLHVRAELTIKKIVDGVVS